MLINDLLKNLDGSIVEYATVEGSKIKVKRGQLSRSNTTLYLHCVDKLGRKTGGCISIILHTWGNKPYYEYTNCYSNPRKIRIYPSKEDAYRGVIDKLKQKRQEINKKIIEVQMQAFGKRIENV